MIISPNEIRWAVYFLRMAQLTASKSKDTTKVGCVLVEPKFYRVLAQGFNGIPRGVHDDREEYPSRYQRPEKYIYVVHAEANAIAAAAAAGAKIKDSVAYCTLHPCVECTKLLIQAGITTVFYLKEPESLQTLSNNWRDLFPIARTIAREAGVSFIECELQANTSLEDIQAEYMKSMLVVN